MRAVANMPRCTFNSNLFDFLCFLINPFISADLLCGAHDLLQLLYFLRGKDKLSGKAEIRYNLH